MLASKPKMSSTRRILASRANGAQSRGPVTPQGKERSSLNALQHGLAARAVVVQGESADAFDATMDQFLLRFQPFDDVELSLVQEMAAAAWRLHRAWDIEGRLFDRGIGPIPDPSSSEQLTAAFCNIAVIPQFGLLHRYETRLHMIFQRALHSLTALQKARMQDEPSPNSEHSPAPEPYVDITVEDPKHRNYNEVVK